MRGEQKGIKVLHVDDELDFLALTKAFLERENENFSIESATSAEEAIKFLKGAKYDVVVSDYEMPVMDGLEFLKTLRASGNTIPFIMFTGKGREEVAIEALNRGADHYLQKGTDIKSMYGTLAHAIKQEVETKRADETLRKSEEKYRGFFKTSRDTAFITSKEGRLIDFNNVTLELLGYKTRDELSKIRIPELYENPEERKKHTKIIEQEGFAKEFPVNLRRKDGSIINTLITSVARKDENGNVIGYQGTIRDITERKQTEKKLKAEKEFSDRLFESSEICLLLINSKREIVRVNDAALKVFDRKREEVLGTICHEFICPAEKGKCPVFDLGQQVDNSERVALNSKGEKVPIIKTVSKIEKEGETYLLDSFIDITERKRAEDKLAKIIDGVNIPAFAINSEHKITHWNTALESLTEVGREDVVGTDKQWIAFYAKKRPVMADLIVDGAPDSEFKDWYGDKYKKSSLIEGAYEALDFFLTLGGKWLLFTASPLKNSEGKIIGAIETLQDITERKRMESELQKETAFTESALNILPDMFYVFDLEGRFLRWNKTSKAVTGYSDEVISSMKPTDFFSEEDKERVEDAIGIVVKEGHASVEATLITKDGRHIPYEFSGALLKDREGNLLGISGTGRDITERKRVKEALKESESRFRSIIESSKEGIIFFDGKTRKIIFGNGAMAELLVCSKEDLVGRSISSLHPSEEWASIEQEFQKHVSGEISVSTGIPVVRNDGSVFYADISSSLITLEGKAYFSAFFRDVTERKQAEEALRASERVHQIILDSVPVSIFHIDANSRFVHVNEVLAKRYGMKPADFKGKTSKELFPEIGEEYVKSDKEVLARGEPQLAVTRKIKTPDGVRWVRLDKVPIKDADGTVTGIIGFELDITKRIEAQEELRNAHKELQDIIEFLPDATFVIDQDKKVIAWNLAMEEMTGIPKDDIIGKGDYEYALPFYGERRPILTDLVFSSDEEIKSRYAQVGKKGNTLFAEIYSPFMYVGKGAHLWGIATPLYDPEGNVVGAIESIRDISERKRAEEALRKSEEKYCSLVESTEDSVYLVDRDCRYLFMNEKHLSRIGLPVDKIIGKTYGELHSEDETEEFAEIVERVFETGKSVQHEHRSRRDNRYFLRTLSPVKDSEGGLTAVTVVSKDITERKRVEEERERLLEELEAKSTELERFAYTVSHDLRSPLITIQGFTDMVQTDLAQNEVEKAKDNLKFIDKAAITMDQLLSATLQLSRAGRMMNPPEDVPFSEIVEDALEQTAAQIKSSGVEVSVAKDFSPVHVDRMRIAEVLVNLIGNSINYRGEQPHPKIEIEHRIDNGERVFFVRDNGIGIDPGQHEKVFELFYRVDRGGEGTGAGLAIVKRIIEVHNGRIWIESEKGKGCTICFTLPVK